MHSALVDSATRSARPCRCIRLLRKAPIVACLLLVAVLLVGPAVWTESAIDQNAAERLQSPSPSHPFGTDRYGRDLLARWFIGGRWSLFGATVVCLGVTAIALPLGAIAAARPGRIDSALGSVFEVGQGVPSLVAALAMSAVQEPGFTNLVVALTVTTWPWYARAYRGVFLQGWHATSIEGARAIGATDVWIAVRYLLPALAGPIAVLLSVNLGSAMLNLASLSFLGLGLQPPTPEWGSMVEGSRPFFQSHPWQMVLPGLSIALMVLIINKVGDAVVDVFDPRSR